MRGWWKEFRGDGRSLVGEEGLGDFEGWVEGFDYLEGNREL